MGIIDEEFVKARPKSRDLYREAVETFPAGVTHDTRFLTPFPIYVTHAKGPRKWDVDGHEYIDYVSGHGALLLGHCYPAVVEAVQEQVAKGTHYGACHDLELEWGRLVKQLVPSAQRVRFVSSGTEASLMAVRLARAFTGKNKLLKFEGHFHGWHDQVLPGVTAPWHIVPSVGLLQSTVDTTVLLPINDAPLLERTLAEDKDIAAVIVEPAGASTGTIPVHPGFLAELHRVTQAHGVLLIFDEVVSGFRYSPGGVQAREGIMPDMTILAKVLAGGLPGGAVGGRAEILEPLEFKDDPQWNQRRRVYHPGTFNANPLSAAAGAAALRAVATGEPHRLADAATGELRRRLNAAIDERQAEACVYGEVSVFHVYVGPCEQRGTCDRSLCTNDPLKLKGMPRAVVGGLRRSMMVNGCDMIGAAGYVSSAHGEREVDETAVGFARSLDMMLADGLLKRSTD